MTIAWGEPITIVQRISYPDLWSAPAIGLWIEGRVVPIWRKVGYLRIEPFIDSEYFSHQVKPVDYGKSLIQIPYRSYRLSFEPVESLIEIYSNLSIKIAPIGSELMGINYQNVGKVTGAIVDTGFAPTDTSAQALANDPFRHEGTIYNRTNGTIYVSWGAPASAASSLAVPAGANLDLLEDYTGSIHIVAAAGNLAGDVLIQTISYVGGSISTGTASPSA